MHNISLSQNYDNFSRDRQCVEGHVAARSGKDCAASAVGQSTHVYQVDNNADASLFFHQSLKLSPSSLYFNPTGLLRGMQTWPSGWGDGTSL
jgi:hypothetical protein